MNTKLYIVGAVLIFSIAMASAVQLIYCKKHNDDAVYWRVADLDRRVSSLEKAQ